MTQYRFKTKTTPEQRSFVDLIWAANKAAKDAGEEPLFGEPTFLGEDDKWEGRFREEYPEALVLGPLKHNDDGIRVIPQTKRAAKYCRLGAIEIGYPNIPEEVEE